MLLCECVNVQPARRAPTDLRRPAALPSVIVDAAETASADSMSQRQKMRIINQLMAYQRAPHSSIEVYPNEKNIAFWQFLLTGPEDTPYAGGVWHGYIKFPALYPASPPELRFLTPVCFMSCECLSCCFRPRRLRFRLLSCESFVAGVSLLQRCYP